VRTEHAPDEIVLDIKLDWTKGKPQLFLGIKPRISNFELEIKVRTVCLSLTQRLFTFLSQRYIPRKEVRKASRSKLKPPREGGGAGGLIAISHFLELLKEHRTAEEQLLSRDAWCIFRSLTVSHRREVQTQNFRPIWTRQ
jgi:hypothetical protein